MPVTPYPKPPKRPKKQGGGLQRTSALSQVSKKREKWLKENDMPITTFGRRKPADRLQKRMRWHRATTAWKQPRRLDLADRPKIRKALAKVGPRGRRIEAALRPWRDAVWEQWGACPITGATRESRTAHCHHCYDRPIRPEWVAEPWNGIPLRWDVHLLVDHYPEFHEALQFVADMNRAAHEGKRKPLTRAEVVSIILERAPKVRKYMRQEESA